jgi:hypothetical protein
VSALDVMNAIMTSPLVPTSFNMNATSLMEVDCKAYAMHAVLKNLYTNGTETVVAYTSKRLNPFPTQCCITRRKLQAQFLFQKHGVISQLAGQRLYVLIVDNVKTHQFKHSVKDDQIIR